MKKGVKVLVLIMILMLVGWMFMGVVTAPQPQSAHNINTGESFSTIQAAIDDPDTLDGHTINIGSGIYCENVNVTKRLILKGVDTGMGKPVIDAGGSGNAITLSADGITIEGLTATNSGWGDAGIGVISSNNAIIGNQATNNNWHGIYISFFACNNTIAGNNVYNNYRYGISLYYSHKNTIINNSASGNCEGIRLCDSSNNTITGNNVYNNYEGISLEYSSNNNVITCNKFVNNGLFVYSSYRNIVDRNTVNSKPLVYLEDTSNRVFTKSEQVIGQIIFVNCNNMTVKNLDLSNTSVGMLFWMTQDSMISNNNARSNNKYGIYLGSSRNNTIINNNANNNGGGIYLDYSSNNTIINNNASGNGGGVILEKSNNKGTPDN